MFLTIYGVNNIGKSFQAKLLQENLQKLGKTAAYLKFPIYPIEPSGLHLNRILRSKTPQSISEEELQLWFALNRFQFQPKLKKQLETHDIVIAEDYIGTSLAWGGAKGAAPPWLRQVNAPLIQEDLAILLVGERSLETVEAQHIHENNSQLVEEVAKRLEQLAQEHNWKTVVRQENPQDTQKLIFDIVKQHIN